MLTPLREHHWITNRARLGVEVLFLHAMQSQWIVRRVQSIDFLDRLRIRSRTSVDVILPPPMGSPVDPEPGASHEYWLPIAVMEKIPLRSFDLVDGSGMAVPLVSRDENATTVSAGLAALAAQGMPRAADLVQLVGGTRAEARRAWGRHCGDLDTGTAIGSTVEMLRDNFMLLAAVTGRPGDRILLKFGTDLVMHSPTQRRRTSRFKATVRDAFALDPHPVSYRLPHAAAAASYHADIGAPPELLIERVAILGGESKSMLAHDSPSGGTGRAHVYVNRADLGRGAPNTSLSVLLRKHPRGPIWALFVSLVATVAVLTAGLAAHYSGLVRSGETAGSVLLALLGITAAVQARRGEHPMVTRLDRWTRRAVYLVAAALLTAGTVLGLDGEVTVGSGTMSASELRLWVWRCLLGASVVLLVPVIIGRRRIQEVWHQHGSWEEPS